MPVKFSVLLILGLVSRHSSPAGGYYGSSTPSALLTQALYEKTKWQSGEKEKFLVLAFQVVIAQRKIAPVGRDTVTMYSDEDLIFRLFPELGKVEFISVSTFERLVPLYPKLYQRALTSPFPRAKGFRGFCSPAEFCNLTYGDELPRVLSVDACKRISEVFATGSKWEAKYPAMTYRVFSKNGLAALLQTTFPEIRLTTGTLVSVSQLNQKYQKALRARARTLR